MCLSRGDTVESRQIRSFMKVYILAGRRPETKMIKLKKNNIISDSDE